MKKVLLRLSAKALAIYFLFPKIHHIVVHGDFFTALILALLFTIMLWVVEMVIVLVSTLITLYTLGLALLVLIPLWLVGFWLVPVIALKLVSDFFPEYIQITGWTPAIMGGLLMLLISLMTGSVSVITSGIKRSK